MTSLGNEIATALTLASLIYRVCRVPQIKGVGEIWQSREFKNYAQNFNRSNGSLRLSIPSASPATVHNWELYIMAFMYIST